MRHPYSMRNRLSPIVLAIATALAAPAAFAVPASDALPTNGVVAYSGGASVVASTSQIPNNPGVPGLTTYSTGLTINISGTVASANTPVVIDWNAATGGATLNPNATGGGFNVGSQAIASFVNSAQLSGNTPTTVNVLNIDTTGNPSQIYGQLDYHTPAGGNAGSLWVANANGIVVGSGAAIIAPGGLGLIASPNATSTGTLESTFTSGTAAIDFSGATTTGYVTVDRNANLNGVGSYLLVAGNNVNVATTPGSGNLYIDGGIGANVTTTTGVMTPNDGTSGYTDTTSTVVVNVGSTASPYPDLTALVDGNLTNMGSLTVTQGQINWINGTFVNYGTLDVTPVTGQSYGVLGFDTFTTPYIPVGLTSNTQLVDGNTANPAPTGNFENAGTVNVTAAGSNGFVFFGTGFQNDLGATLNVSGSEYLLTSANGVTLAGIQNSLTGGLTVAALGANSVVNIQSPVTASSGILLAANTANISSTVATPGNFTFYGPESGAAQMNLASGGSITGANLYLGTQGSASPTNFVVNGTMDGTSSVLFGSSGTPTGNVSGAGSITTPSLTFANLQGSVNNIISPVIALNGFKVNASGTGSTIGVSVTADGPGSQGFNLKVNGNLTIDTGGTIAIEPGYLPNNATGGTENLAPANAGSILYVQASGSITATDPGAPNNYGGIAVPNTTYGLFQFPGLVYLQSGTTLDVGSTTTPVVIANAYSPNATFGRAGVFLIAPTINYYANVLYTNGDAGVVFAAPYNGLGFPNAVINGALSSTTNLMPQIDFLRAVTPTTTYPYGLELVPTDTFTNANGNQQQFQTFLNLY